MTRMQEIKVRLYNSIENINDTELLLTVQDIIGYQSNSTDEPIISNWQLERIDESKEQIKLGKYFSNIQADLLVEKWLKE